MWVVVWGSDGGGSEAGEAVGRAVVECGGVVGDAMMKGCAGGDKGVGCVDGGGGEGGDGVHRYGR